MTFLASSPLVHNASLTLMLAVLLLPISSLWRFITFSTLCVDCAVPADLAVVPSVLVANASSFVRADLVTIRSVGAGALRGSHTGDCTGCASWWGTGSLSSVGVSTGVLSGSVDGASGGGVVRRVRAPQLFEGLNSDFIG